jgi:hypothetical protein
MPYDPTPQGASLPSAAMLDTMAGDDDYGAVLGPEDRFAPRITVGQNNSPACDRSDPNYIEGANPGDFLIHGDTKRAINGETGILVIPFHRQKAVLEWLPGRQGFVAHHLEIPADATTPAANGQDLLRANGNIIQRVTEVFVLFENQPYVLTCASTKLTFDRQWATYLAQLRHPSTGKVLPMFCRQFKLTTTPAHNALGRWFGLKFSDEGWVPEPAYHAAKALADIARRSNRIGANGGTPAIAPPQA